MTVRIAALAIALVLSACTVEPIDLTGRACPCVAGYVCDPATSTCVRRDGGRDDAGPGDAGRDADPATDSGRDAGTDAAVDAGTDAAVDAGFDAGPPRETGCDDDFAGALFCDGFEDGTFDLWDREVAIEGEVNWSGENTYRGRGALRAHTTLGSGHAFMQADVFTGGQTDLWLRAYHFFPSDFVVSGFEVHKLLQPTNSFSVVLSFYDGGSDLHAHSFAGDPRMTSGAIPRDTWVCIEMHVVIAPAPAGLMEFFVEGIPYASIPGLDTTPPASALSAIGLGIVWTGKGQEPFRLYVDEVVADDSRVGCD